MKKKLFVNNLEIDFDSNDITRELFGEYNENIKIVEKRLDVTINIRGNKIFIGGSREEDIEFTKKLLNELYDILRKGHNLYPIDIDYAIKILRESEGVRLRDIFLDNICISTRKKAITPKSIIQKEYVDAIRKYDIVFGIGPAGTGKTYLAMAMAVSSFVRKETSRIIFTRPAVEAGEKLGFLPGDISEKINPYLRPLYDALYDMIDFDRATKLIDKGIIEIAPLAFMRGRTLNDSFIILDEAQNTTSEQMKMFLTRIGFSSKAVITGDITQVDLPSDKGSGLIDVQRILKNIEGIKFIYFSEKDVVRHPLVKDIIKAYEREERELFEKRNNRALEKEDNSLFQ